MNKRILLANPNESKILDHYGDRAPLNLLYIAAYMRKQGHQVKVWDGNHQSESELLDMCNKLKPDYIGISIYTSPILNVALDLAKLIKKFYPPANIIAGGYHANVMYESLLKDFDYVCVGEGERVIEEILKNPDEKIVRPPKVENLDDLPLPARDLVNMGWYNLQQNGKRTVTLITSRGCPYDCIFCGNINRRVRFHSPERVEEEVKELKEKYGFESFYFYDDMFNFNRERTFEIIKKLKRLNISYRIMMRADSLDENLIKSLADSGCKIMNLGIESGNNEILRRANKRMTKEQNEEAVKLCHKHGITVRGCFMLGLPGENWGTANQTIEFAKSLKSHGLIADFYVMVPFPGTKIWDNPKKYGIEIVDRNFAEYVQVGRMMKPKIRTESLSEDDLTLLLKKAKEEFENA